MNMLNEVSNTDRVTITISRENLRKMKRLGVSGDSLNVILGRLLDSAMGGMMSEENQQCH